MNASLHAPPNVYWEERAQRYALKGEGLAAVCSYGMPGFYNRAIHLTQWLGLKPWIKSAAGNKVLDVGCGVGRWSRLMASHGACVTGVDFSQTMVAEATRRATEDGIADRCRFLMQDLAEFDTGSQYNLIIGVTVLQHILELNRLKRAVRCIRDHLTADGRVVLIEAAPTHSNADCDNIFFKARTLDFYRDLFADCGLRPEMISGIDPMPLKTKLLPHYRGLPKPLAVIALAAATAVSIPFDSLFGRRCVNWSWHKLFVLKHDLGSVHGR